MSNWRLYLGGSVLAAAFSAGWYLKPMPPPVIQEARTEVVVEKIVTITKRPDGTIIQKTEDKKKEIGIVASKPAPVPVPVKPQYSVAVYAIPKWNDIKNPGWAIGVGRRIGQTNAWFTGEYTYKRDLLIGMRIDF